MSDDIDELLNNPTVKTIKKVAELSSAFVGAVGAGVQVTNFLINWMNLGSPRPDPILESLKEVHAHLSRIEDTVVDADIADRQRHLEIMVAQASTGARTAAEFFRSGATSVDPLWHGRLSVALRDTDMALTTVIGNVESGSFWTRPENPSAISQEFDPALWMDLIPDRAELVAPRRVWDYRWGLPAMMHAIMAHMMVLTAFNPDRSRILGDYRRISRAVKHVFRRMDQGVRELELNDDHIRRIATHGIPVAVVDIHGGLFAGGVEFKLFSSPESSSSLKFHNPTWPYPFDLIIPGGQFSTVVRNAKTLSQHWANMVRLRMGLSELLMVAGQFESLVQNPFPVSSPVQQASFTSLIYLSEQRAMMPNPEKVFHVPGPILGVDPQGNMRWYHYTGDGQADETGTLGWNQLSGNLVGQSWGSLKRVFGGNKSVMFGVDAEDFLRYYFYKGGGALDPDAKSGWTQASSNRIGRGWGGFTHICATAGDELNTTSIYAVDASGTLRWYGYAGQGEPDETGTAGWLPKSGSIIGDGFEGIKFFIAAKRNLYTVGRDGLLRWYRYEGDGTVDWHRNSGNPIGRGWESFQALFGGIRDDQTDVLFGVATNGNLLWYVYDGEGVADASGATGWVVNSGNPIGRGFSVQG